MGCHGKYPCLGSLNDRHFFVMVLEAERSLVTEYGFFVPALPSVVESRRGLELPNLLHAAVSMARGLEP